MDVWQKSYAGGSWCLRELVDLVLDVLVNAQQYHIVDSGAKDNDGKSPIHAGPGDCLGSRGDLLGLTKEDALRTGLAGVKGVGLEKSQSSVLYAVEGLNCIRRTKEECCRWRRQLRVVRKETDSLRVV